MTIHLKNHPYFDSYEVVPINGGSINKTYRLKDKNGTYYFCKQNSATIFPQLFEKEAAGLQLIKERTYIKVPEVIDVTTFGEEQFLLMEWIESGNRTNSFWKKFGESLAQLHSVKHPDFGLENDNYMGSVPQQNTWSTKWSDFFLKYRLEPLIEKCLQQNLLNQKHKHSFQKLAANLSSIFNNDEKPALVHGDLWSGNFMCSNSADLYFIDPAPFFGHPSVDLGMTTLFGGFHPLFYESYQYHYHLPNNSREQWSICNLYPLLIHLLLFGKSYLSQIENTLHRFDWK